MKTVATTIVVFAMFALIIVGWVKGCSRSDLPDQRIEHVVRVLMHEPGRFTIISRVPNSKELNQITLGERFPPITTVRIFTDVPVNAEMWALVKSHGGGGGMQRGEITIDLLELHLHSPSDINGGGWDHGKFGRGQTTVVE